MKTGWKPRLLLLFAAALVVVLLFENTATAQCSMCRASLGGSNNAFFIRNFNIGVMVLLIPPVTIFCSIFVALKRYKAPADVETKKDPICSSPEPQ